MSNTKKERQRWRNQQAVTGCHASGNTVLIPGEEWHPLDGVPAPEYIPDQWDGPHVGKRLVEAFRTLANVPEGGRAPGASGFWPETFDEVDNTAEEDMAKLPRSRVIPSAQEIARMEMAICWPARHLSAVGLPDLARVVQRVAFYRSLEMDMDHVARRMRLPAPVIRRDNRDGLDRVAASLRRERLPVF